MIGAIFDRLEGKARREEGAGEGTANRSTKRKNKKQRREDSLVAAADRKGSQKPTEGTLNHFKKNARGAMPEPRLSRKASAQGLRPHAEVLVRKLQQRRAGE